MGQWSSYAIDWGQRLGFKSGDLVHHGSKDGDGGGRRGQFFCFLLSSGFGFRPDPITHQTSMDDCIDFVAVVVTSILVKAPGVVSRAVHMGAYGNMVDVLHANGCTTRYAHMQSIEVKPGDVLVRQQKVGILGNTGRSTEPHFHFEVVYNGVAMHPTKALAAWVKL